MKKFNMLKTGKYYSVGILSKKIRLLLNVDIQEKWIWLTWLIEDGKIRKYAYGIKEDFDSFEELK